MASSPSPTEEIISSDLIDRRGKTEQLLKLVKISAAKDVIKQSTCVVVNSRHSIPVQSYHKGEETGCIFYIPGTASVANCAVAIEAHASQMAAILNQRVIVIHPRMVPENKHPTPYNDCVAVINHLIDYGHDTLVDDKGSRIEFKTMPLAIAGFSSGALLATQIYLNSLKQASSVFCQLLAIAPIVDIATLTQLSYRENQQHFKEIFERFAQLYLPMGQALDSIHHSPWYMDISALPHDLISATFVVGNKDPLFPRVNSFSQALIENKSDTRIEVIPDFDHSLTWLSTTHLEVVKARFTELMKLSDTKEYQPLARLTKWLDLTAINKAIEHTLLTQIPPKLSGEQFDIDKDYLPLTLKNAKLDGHVVTDEENLFLNHSKVLIGGEMGSGKTTYLYRYVLRQLQNTPKQQFKTCLFIRCRDFALLGDKKVGAELTLRGLLFQLFIDKLITVDGKFHSRTSLTALIKLIASNSDSILIAFDGLDELPNTVAAKHNLNFLLQYFTKVIVTGRQHALEDYSKREDFAKLDLQPLSSAVIKQRLENVTDKPGYSTSIPLHSPLLLDLYRLYSASTIGSDAMNQFELLQNAVFSIIKRYELSRFSRASSSRRSVVSFQRTKVWQLAKAIAANQNLQLLFSLDDLDKIAENLTNTSRFFALEDCDELFSDKGAANCGLLKLSKVGIEFIHPSFQAFFLAYHWLDLLKSNPAKVHDLLAKYKFDDQYHHFWTLLAGLLSQHPEQLIIFFGLWQRVTFHQTRMEIVDCYFYEGLASGEIPDEIQLAKESFLSTCMEKVIADEYHLSWYMRHCSVMFDTIYIRLLSSGLIKTHFSQVINWLRRTKAPLNKPMIKRELMAVVSEWREITAIGAISSNLLEKINCVNQLFTTNGSNSMDEELVNGLIELVASPLSQSRDVLVDLGNYVLTASQISQLIGLLERSDDKNQCTHVAKILYHNDSSLATPDDIERLVMMATTSSKAQSQQMAWWALATMPQSLLLPYKDNLIPCLSLENLTTCYYVANALSRISDEVIRQAVIVQFPRLYFSDKDKHCLVSSIFADANTVVSLLGNKIWSEEFTREVCRRLCCTDVKLKKDTCWKVLILSEKTSPPATIIDAVLNNLTSENKHVLMHTISTLKNLRLAGISDENYQVLLSLIVKITNYVEKENLFSVLMTAADKTRVINIIEIIKEIDDYSIPVGTMMKLVRLALNYGIAGACFDVLMEKVLHQLNDRLFVNKEWLQLRTLLFHYHQFSWLEKFDFQCSQFCSEIKLYQLYTPDSDPRTVVENLSSTYKLKIQHGFVQQFRVLLNGDTTDVSELLDQFNKLLISMSLSVALDKIVNCFDDLPIEKVQAFTQSIINSPGFYITYGDSNSYLHHDRTHQLCEISPSSSNRLIAALARVEQCIAIEHSPCRASASSPILH